MTSRSVWGGSFVVIISHKSEKVELWLIITPFFSKKIVKYDLFFEKCSFKG